MDGKIGKCWTHSQYSKLTINHWNPKIILGGDQYFGKNIKLVMFFLLYSHGTSERQNNKTNVSSFVVCRF